MSKSERKQYEIMQVQARRAQMDERLSKMQDELNEIQQNMQGSSSSSSDEADEQPPHNDAHPGPAARNTILPGQAAP